MKKINEYLKNGYPIIFVVGTLSIAHFVFGIELSSGQYLLGILLVFGLAAIYDKLSKTPHLSVLVIFRVQQKGEELDWHELTKRMDFPIVPRVGDYVCEFGESFGQVSSVSLHAAAIEFGDVTDARVSCSNEVRTAEELREIVEKLVDQGWHDKHHCVEPVD